MSHIWCRRRVGTAAIVRAFAPASWMAVVIAGLTLTPQPAAAQTGVTNSSRRLLAMPAADLMRLLDSTRPPPISDERKAHVLSSLPPEGEVTELDPLTRQKLATLAPVLRAAKRETVYAIKVIAVRQAFIGLHARALLLVSDRAPGVARCG